MLELMNTVNNALKHQNNYPAFRIYENDDSLLLESEIPGVNPEHINLELNDNVLTINFEKKFEEDQNTVTLRNEREFGKFTRSFQLPFRIKEDEIQAEYKYGVLKVHLPKAEEEKPKKIAIKTS